MDPPLRHLTLVNDSFDDDDGDDGHLHKCRMANLTLLHHQTIEKYYSKGVKRMNLVVDFDLIFPFHYFIFLHFRSHLDLNLE